MKVFRDAPVLIAIVDLNTGIYVEVNEEALRVSGFAHEEVIGHAVAELGWISSQDRARLVKEVRDHGRIDGLEMEFRTKDGHALHGLVNGEQIVIGGRSCLLTVTIDITKRKQAEEALRESQSLYHSLVEVSPLSICRKDLEGRFTFANQRFLELSHITLADLIGKTDFDLHPPELAEKYQRDEKAVLDSRQVWELIEERTLLSGESSIVQSIKVPTYDGTGKINGVQTSFWDITQHKRAEEQLRKLSRAVDQSPASIVITDLQGNIEYVNPKFSQVTGYSFEESLGKNPRILKSGKTTGEEYKVMWDTILAGNVWQGELLNKKKNGEDYWEFATIAPVFGEDGKITNFLALKENITERKQAEEIIKTTNILLEQTLEQSPVPMVLVSMPDSIIRSANSACRRFLGVEDEPSPVGTPLSELKISWQDFDLQGNPATIADLPLPRSLMGLKTFQERHLIRKDGTSVYGLIYGSPIFDAEGRVIAGYLVMIDITQRKRAEQDINQRVKELELLYQSGLVLSQLLNPKEIGQKILDLLKEKLDWHHTRIRLYHPQDDRLELLDFNQPGLEGEVERQEVVERLQTLITGSDKGMSGWVIQHGQPVRSGDVSNDPRYVEAYPGIRSGLYVPMKLGERIVGVIGVESEEPDAFSEADERLVLTLANQAASAFENARLFGEIHQRVMELETINRISLVLRAVSKQEEMLSIVLDEALTILNTSHGSIELYNKTTNTLEKTITRGWITQVIDLSQKSSEGIAGKVFTSGEIYISREFASDPESRAAARSQMPPGWGGVCVPIRTTQHTLGVLLVSIPSERELNSNEIRLLATLSEMTGAALQRMQLHEQTVNRLEQLHALRAVDQAIASNLDMRLTLNILLDQTVSQLSVDAADVFLLPAGSSMLELAASRGFHSHLLGSINLSDSFALRAIMEHRTISAMDFEIAALHENPQFGKLWKVEGFACYWCVPLIVKGEIKGILEVYCRKAFTPDADWLEFLEALGGQAAITIDTAQLFENLQRANLDLSLAYDATIEGWSRAMDLRDHETEGHTLRVTDLTMKLARAMRISESQLTAIRRGALLHDIGKMGVPDAILLKEGALTDEEWALMRQHPQLAHDMLAPIAYLNDALDIPYCHHEKWDGTGYPQGLKGERIPLIARIFAVVDVWDALTNDRTYRSKWSKEETLQYIKEQSGRHFDPQVVDVFLKHIEV